MNIAAIAPIEFGEREDWTVERLGRIARVFNGSRFKRPYADRNVISGPGIVPYFTANAATQSRGANLKYLDLGKASGQQLRTIEHLYMRRGMILITDSGTVGRVIYATNLHDGAVGTNNLIRVVIEDEALRGYVYQFLLSPMGQNQLKANIYGAIVDHLEPDDVKELLVPLPTRRADIETVGMKVIESVRLQEAAGEIDQAAQWQLDRMLEPVDESGVHDDERHGISREVFLGLLRHIAEVPLGSKVLREAGVWPDRRSGGGVALDAAPCGRSSGMGQDLDITLDEMRLHNIPMYLLSADP